MNQLHNWTVQKGALPYRQAQVIAGIANGLTDAEIAEEAGIQKTVVSHTVSTLFYKFGLGRGRRAALVAEAIRSGFLQSSAVMMLLLFVQVLSGPDIDWRRTKNPTRTRPVSTRIVRRGREFDYA